MKKINLSAQTMSFRTKYINKCRINFLEREFDHAILMKSPKNFKLTQSIKKIF
jgi:hypothetical protein